MPPRLVPFVEIIIRPKGNKRSRSLTCPSPEPSTAPLPSPSRTSHKRRKDEQLAERLCDDEVQSDPASRTLSPTVSTFDDDAPPALLNSPTVSEFDRLSPGITGIDEDEETGSKRSRVSSSPHNYGGRTVEQEAETYQYEVEEDEIEEDGTIYVLGETPAGGDDDDIPVRLLTDFTIYDLSTREVVCVGELQQLGFTKRQYGASGKIKPWFIHDGGDISDEDGDEFDEDLADGEDVLPADQTKLTKIIEFNVYDLSERRGNIDSKIYIRTSYAWYILGFPSATYEDFFTPFWIRHQLVYRLASEARKHIHMTYQSFIDTLGGVYTLDKHLPSASDLLGRDLTQSDLELPDIKAYIIAILLELQADFQITRVPLIRSILDGAVEDVGLSPTKKSRRRVMTKNRNQENEVLKHRETTFLTPIVSQIAQHLFDGSLVASDPIEEMEVDNQSLKVHKTHHENPLKIVWGQALGQNVEFFENITVDGVRYQVGDVVMVQPEGGERAKHSSSQSTVNQYGQNWWFCYITHFFEHQSQKGRTKMFHGQWFVHGSETVLQETAHSRALFLLNSCNSNPINAIYQKCNFRFLELGEQEPFDDFAVDANDFHCSYLYDDDHAKFTHIPSDFLDNSHQSEPCFSCHEKQKEKNQQKLYLLENGFTQHGVNYHIHDFTYIRPHGNVRVLNIAQITNTKKDGDDLRVSVQYLGRYKDDERHLYMTNKKEQISSDMLEGVCYLQYLTNVEAIECWVSHDDHFYLNQEQDDHGNLSLLNPGKFRFCQICQDGQKQVIKDGKGFSQQNSKLIGMELFSGAGGLGLGIDMSGFVETKYAVEFSPSAAKTYKTNNPDVLVYNQDSSTLLQQALAKDNGKNPPPLLSKDGKTHCPEMPQKGCQVDFIFGGPPCQSFSLANHHRKKNDIRSTLPCSMLSYVEYYNPDYFLLENVRGLLSHTLQDGRTNTVVQAGMVKFICRTSLALGYQIHYKLLQASHYGTPQGRSRVIFWGAKQGLVLPQFPLPSHAFEGRLACPSLPTGGHIPPPSRSKISGDYHQYAPLKPILVDDAIGDLPPFEWTNPHQVIPRTSSQKDKRRSLKTPIPQFDAVLLQGNKGTIFSNPGFPEGVPYMSGPQNRYQKWLRQGMVDEESDTESEVQDHFTSRFSAFLIEASVTVPLRPYADHKALPTELQPTYAMAGRKQWKHSFYGRMDGDGQFKCTMTRASPNLKNSWLLHPHQKRMISIRECARSQGFPDGFIFESSNEHPQRVVAGQKMRQIGNAVAVPFALALGKELGTSLIQQWKEKQRVGSISL